MTTCDEAFAVAGSPASPLAQAALALAATAAQGVQWSLDDEGDPAGDGSDSALDAADEATAGLGWSLKAILRGDAAIELRWGLGYRERWHFPADGLPPGVWWLRPAGETDWIDVRAIGGGP